MQNHIDRQVGWLGCVLLPAMVWGRWRSYFADYLLLFYLCVPLAFYLCLAVLPERWYRRHRTLIILLGKAVVCGLPAARRQVRLQAPPTGSLLADLTMALIGLRQGASVLAGMLRLPWTLWLLQQAVFVVGYTNLDADCASPWFSNALTVGRIEMLHRFMLLVAKPLLPQAALLLPSTDAGRCKAAVTFFSMLLGLLLPAVLLVQPENGTRSEAPAPSLIMGAIRRLDALIEESLRALRYPDTPGKMLLAWWAAVLLLWAAALCLTREG